MEQLILFAIIILLLLIVYKFKDHIQLFLNKTFKQNINLKNNVSKLHGSKKKYNTKEPFDNIDDDTDNMFEHSYDDSMRLSTSDDDKISDMSNSDAKLDIETKNDDDDADILTE